MGKEGAKMANAAKLAAATAVTVDQKVKAAQAESKAQTLKVSGEQKLASATPALQKAKVQEEKAANKASTDKDLMASDESKLTKAVAKDNAAKQAVDKANAKGPVEVVKQDEKIVVGLAAESAKLSGCNMTANAVDAARAKSKKLHNKAQAAVSKVKELHTKLKKKRELASKEVADKAAKERTKKRPELTSKAYIRIKTKEANLKQYMKNVKHGTNEVARKTHLGVQELEGKEERQKKCYQAARKDKRSNCKERLTKAEDRGSRSKGNEGTSNRLGCHRWWWMQHR